MSAAAGHVVTASVLRDGKLWLIGGESHLGGTSESLAVYDPSSNTWAMGPPTPDGGRWAYDRDDESWAAAILDGVIGEIHIATSGRTIALREEAWVEVAAGHGKRSSCACALLLG